MDLVRIVTLLGTKFELQTVEFMYTAKLFDTPDKTWVDEARGCINLYTIDDLRIESNQIGFIRFGDFKCELSDGTLAIGFVDRKKSTIPIKLYYPQGFVIKGKSDIYIAIDNRDNSTLIIPKGTYLSTLRLMTTQFYNLMRRNDGSDRGLRPSYIKIEFYGKNVY